MLGICKSRLWDRHRLDIPQNEYIKIKVGLLLYLIDKSYVCFTDVINNDELVLT